MNAEKAKKAVELAEKELRQEEEAKQIKLIKEVIKRTLESIKSKEKERNKLNKEIKTLKQDIDNIRAGRLDLIAERQEKDEEAKRTSIIEVVKEIHHHHYRDRWYEPYKITYKWGYNPPLDYMGSVTCEAGTLPNTVSGSFYTLTNDTAKNAVAGTYKLDNGDCVTLT